MMSENIETTALSGSLVNRDIYSVCCTALECIENFHGELYQLREQFFVNGKHGAHLKLTGQYLGCESKAAGSITAHSLKWKKTANRVRIEEAFYLNNTYVIVVRDLNGSISGKIHFDKGMRWIKTEYFSAADYRKASTILKPGETNDTLERFTYNENRKNYDSETLFPIPYENSSPRQNILNANCGDSLVLVATAQGEFCYCPLDEQKERLRILESIENGSTQREPEWAACDEEPSEAESSPEEAAREFRTLTEVAIEEAKPSAPETTEEVALSEEDLVLQVENEEIPAIPSPAEKISSPNGAFNIYSSGEKYNYTGKLMAGLREGRGRTDQPNGVTVFDGEYRHGLKHGYGTSYYADGDLSYVGSWKNDKKDGVGVSFRESDHAMHVTTWKDGAPGEMATLFDPQGNMRYSGKLIHGKKQGVGLSYDPEKDTVFVGKYVGEDEPHEGALFDSDGNLLYFGHWKEGKRSGRGTQFDQNGEIVYSGEWRDDSYFSGILYQKIEDGDE
ncbi:MAG: hypothetical protein RSC76_01355 [Oscillospiraceae bacterium]